MHFWRVGATQPWLKYKFQRAAWKQRVRLCRSLAASPFQKRGDVLCVHAYISQSFDEDIAITNPLTCSGKLQ